jgi:hypothetical protein
MDPIYPEVSREYGKITEREWHGMMRDLVVEARRADRRLDLLRVGILSTLAGEDHECLPTVNRTLRTSRRQPDWL